MNIDPTGDKGLWDRGLLNGASQKVEVLCSFYLGESITSLQKTTLIPGGNDAIVYTTLSGSIGMLVPFSSNEVKSRYYDKKHLNGFMYKKIVVSIQGPRLFSTSRNAYANRIYYFVWQRSYRIQIILLSR